MKLCAPWHDQRQRPTPSSGPLQAALPCGLLQAELHQLTGSVLRLTAEHNSLLGSAELLETGIEARLATQHAIKAALQENTSRRFNQ